MLLSSLNSLIGLKVMKPSPADFLTDLIDPLLRVSIPAPEMALVSPCQRLLRAHAHRHTLTCAAFAQLWALIGIKMFARPVCVCVCAPLATQYRVWLLVRTHAFAILRRLATTPTTSTSQTAGIWKTTQQFADDERASQSVAN